MFVSLLLTYNVDVMTKYRLILFPQCFQCFTENSEVFCVISESKILEPRSQRGRRATFFHTNISGAGFLRRCRVWYRFSVCKRLQQTRTWPPLKLYSTRPRTALQHTDIPLEPSGLVEFSWAFHEIVVKVKSFGGSTGLWIKSNRMYS